MDTIEPSWTDPIVVALILAIIAVSGILVWLSSRR